MAVGDEAAGGQAARARGDGGFGVEVAGDFARRGAGGERLMAEDEGADGEVMGDLAAEDGGRVGVVVAGDPGPAVCGRQAADRGHLRWRQARGGLCIVEAVAEADDVLDRVAGEYGFECCEGGAAVIGGQQEASACEA